LSSGRETFTSRFGLLMTMVGAAVGLGAVWRFPYMAGRFGGAAFVLFYLAVMLLIGIPALMAEWSLGRSTGRGTLGAFERGGFPGGRYVGGFLFGIVFFATGYYSNAVGWVAFHALGEAAKPLGLNFQPGAILPPESGFNHVSLVLQMLMTVLVISACGLVLIKGLRRGIERASKIIVPSLFIILLVLIARAVTLPGAGEGIKWYIGSFRFHDLTPANMAAALGMAFFSLSLGGTFMVIYGSYMERSTPIPRNAVFTGVSASLAGILAGFAIFPAVFAFGLEPASGPGLIFTTLPRTFDQMPAGWLFGLLFFLGLFGAAFLSDVAAFEVLVGGLVDNSRLSRRRAVVLACCVVFVLSILPMINYRVFIPWDLMFGSGMQALGSLLAVLTAVWCFRRAEALKELSAGSPRPFPKWLYWWLRVAVPVAILIVGLNWLLTTVF
jgi:NSS family neurotransmitter:Na+ symporter